MNFLKIYNKTDVLSLTKLRRFETKIGERIGILDTKQNDLAKALGAAPQAYVLFGIPEDIGIKANLGKPGASTAWVSFLHSFLNVQSNDWFVGENILLLGHFNFNELDWTIQNNAANEAEKVDAYRHAVGTIDDAVEWLVKIIVAAGKIPIAIGGGHNNAYPLLKGSAKGLAQLGLSNIAQINCINLDAHTDFRPLEGRHSGNAFRYAENDGYLGKYAIVGAHESYVPQNVLEAIVQNPFIRMFTYETIFLQERLNFSQAVTQSLAFVEDNYVGVELDLDCIENALSSASTPAGISALQARQYLMFAAQDAKVAYLHLCEGAVQVLERKDESTGKLLSYLLIDFVKTHQLYN